MQLCFLAALFLYWGLLSFILESKWYNCLLYYIIYIYIYIYICRSLRHYWNMKETKKCFMTLHKLFGDLFISQKELHRYLLFWLDFYCRAWFWEAFLFFWGVFFYYSIFYRIGNWYILTPLKHLQSGQLRFKLVDSSVFLQDLS